MEYVCYGLQYTAQISVVIETGEGGGAWAHVKRIYHQYDGGWNSKYRYLRSREFVEPMITR